MMDEFNANSTSSLPTASPWRVGDGESSVTEANNMFRRCSLDHTRQNSARKQMSAMSSDSSPPATKDDGNSASSAWDSIRSSLRSSSTSSTGSTASASTTSSASSSSTGNTAASPKLAVTFRDKVDVRPIAPKTDAEIRTLWLSQEERQAIQLQANADLRTLKRLSKLPADVQATHPDVRAARSSMSLRGLEQFASKRLHRALWALQADHLHAVLDAQAYQRQLHRMYGRPVKDTDLAEVSREKSQQFRERAVQQGREDEAAARRYLGL